MPSLNTGNAILSNAIAVDSSYNVGIGGAASGSFKLQVTGTSNLTGALSGTSATFSSSVTAGATIQSTTTSTNPAFLAILPANANATILQSYSSNSGFGWKLQQEEVSTGDFRIFRRESSVDYQVLNLARSTGAATFSSSVTAESVTQDSSLVQQWVYKSATTAYRLQLNTIVSSNLVRYSFDLTNNSTAFPNNLVLDRGNVGIGTSSPSQLLHIQKDQNTATNLLIRNDSSGASAEAYMNVSNGTYLTAIGTRGTGTAAFNSLDTNSGMLNYNGNTSLTINATDASAVIKFTTNNFTERMIITSGGQIQVKQASNSFTGGFGTINLSGNIWSILAGGDNNFYIGFNYSALGYFSSSTGTYVPLSNKNKKKDFEQSTIGLNAILGLKPTLYRMKTEDDLVEKQLGFIAQEVKEFIPQAFVESEDFIGLNYNAIVTTLVKAIQELNQKVNDQQQTINSLINR